MKILFICSSNICRSPYCEYVFKKMIKENPALAEIVSDVKSSAVFNKSFTIHPKARLSLLREGFTEEEIKAHRPTFKWSDKQRFDDADVIIGMTKSNKIFLPRRYWDKFITLSEAATGEYISVEDPYLLRDIEKYYKVMDKLKLYLEKYAEKLIQ